MKEQAGIYEVTLYEDKEFEVIYDSNGEVISFSNTGDSLLFDNDEGKGRLSDEINSGFNRIIINDYNLNIEINSLENDSFDKIVQLSDSIYGWIPVIEYLDNTKKLINTAFFLNSEEVDTQVSHTFKINMKPRKTTNVNFENIVS